MRLSRKIMLIISFLWVIVLFSVRISAEDGLEFTLENGEEGYTLSLCSGENTEKVLVSKDFTEISDYLNKTSSSAIRLIFNDTEINESIEFESGKYVFSGALNLCSDAELIISGADITFSELDLEIRGGQVRIKEGTLIFKSGNINSLSGRAISIDYSAFSGLEILGGKITSSGADSTIKCKYGSVKIYSGEIVNTEGAAVESYSTLVLENSPKIKGIEYDVITAVPLNLGGKTGSFCGNLNVKYQAIFNKGEIKSVFYSASEKSVEGITLYDLNGEKQKISYFEEYKDIGESNFIAVYLPYEVEFIADEKLLKSVHLLRGDVLSAPVSCEKEGYRFVGWSKEENGELFDFSQKITEDLKLYAIYRLVAPEFSISSLSFVYDGVGRTLSLDSLKHPLLDEALVTYSWYKDGEKLSLLGEGVNISKVSESGKYKCKIVFSIGKDSVSVTTPEVNVTVSKAELPIPEIASKEYNGEVQKPDLFSTGLYSVETSGGIPVGVYPVKISLCDSENYEFAGNLGSAITVDFEITPAKNFWTDLITAENAYEGQAPSHKATARFGEVYFKYSRERDGIYSTDIPKTPGEYFVKAFVDKTENYNSLISDPVSILIIEEVITGISVEEGPNKKIYTAFEEFSLEGLVISVSFNSKRQELLEGEEAEIKYQSAESLRFGDSGVIASYGGFSVVVPVTVNKAEYDISDLELSADKVYYDGSKKTISVLGELPKGLDGIPLCYSVVGGGVNSGDYTVIISFETQSTNYSVPEKIEKTLTVMPYESEVIWGGVEFVYDGELKCPSAYYLDIHGRKIIPEINGGRSHAGEYSAVAVPADSNYKLISSSIQYFIRKADYDFTNTKLSESQFVYDGKEHSVTLIGLPSGVSVIGYSDNKGTDAGEYSVKFTFSYDENNYNEPNLSFVWEILKADYDLSDLIITDLVTEYDGLLHYPTVSGKMPVGVDGIGINYKFSNGVRDVKEGRAAVEVVFTTESKNYNVPDSVIAYVEITPVEISVSWSGLEFTYDGLPHIPKAESELCRIEIVGEKTNAGEYTASAVSLDSNYKIVNSEQKYVIKKAKNKWKSEITVENVYEGQLPFPYAQALEGEIEYVYSTDAEGKEIIEAPTAVGKYYVYAKCSAGENYESIESEIISFEIIKVVPVAMTVLMNKTDFYAFDKLSAGWITVTVENNDGSIKTVDYNDITVKYSSGDSLRHGKETVTVFCLGFEEKIELEVKKADYDLSGATWGETRFVYDGKEKKIILSGLPEGIVITSYSGGVGTGAGSYPVSCEFTYDSENYNPPILPEGILVIEKSIVTPPIFEKLVYNGDYQLPHCEEKPTYTVEGDKNKSAGKYTLILKITDSENYSFPDGKAEITVEYEILPREITVKLGDVEAHKNEKYPEPSVDVIVGEIIGEEDIGLVFSYNENEVFATSGNSDYRVTVIPGKLTLLEGGDEGKVFEIFLFVLILIAVTLLILILVLRRKQLARCIGKVKYRLSHTEKTESITDKAPVVAESAPKEPENAKKEDASRESVKAPIESVMSLNADRADRLISDSLAKELVRKDENTVYTGGNKKRVINVDTLSENFSSGERVDVNRLKEMSLVPYDTAYIKVLARGMIDKPLRVYANDFSLSAVKMIALTGGEARRVTTVSVKRKSSQPKLEEKTKNT